MSQMGQEVEQRMGINSLVFGDSNGDLFFVQLNEPLASSGNNTLRIVQMIEDGGEHSESQRFAFDKNI